MVSMSLHFLNKGRLLQESTFYLLTKFIYSGQLHQRNAFLETHTQTTLSTISVEEVLIVLGGNLKSQILFSHVTNQGRCDRIGEQKIEKRAVNIHNSSKKATDGRRTLKEVSLRKKHEEHKIPDDCFVESLLKRTWACLGLAY